MYLLLCYCSYCYGDSRLFWDEEFELEIKSYLELFQLKCYLAASPYFVILCGWQKKTNLLCPLGLDDKFGVVATIEYPNVCCAVCHASYTLVISVEVSKLCKLN